MNTVKIVKSNLVEATVFLNCGGEGSRHNCVTLRNELVKKISDVTEAETVEANIGGKTFCVSGTALVRKKDVPDFKQRIEQLKTILKKEGIRIEDSKVILEKTE